MIYLDSQFFKIRHLYDKVVFYLLALCICTSFLFSFFGDHQATAARVKFEHKNYLTNTAIVKAYSDQEKKSFIIASKKKNRANYFYPNYELNKVVAGVSMVPRLFLTKLPQDLKKLKSINQKKEVFIKSILPLILLVNEEIEKDRIKINKMMIRSYEGKQLRIGEIDWLRNITSFYKLDLYDYEELLLRHDIVPPSLALAQAIIESGWGTSRFAQLGNAVFGQWTFQNGAGIVPQKRNEGDMHEVKIFDTLEDSVKQYVMNLNKHNAYKEFRNIRAKMRIKHKKIDGYELAWTMKRYSELGKKYVRSLHVIIELNKLSDFDLVRLVDL